MRMTLVLIFVSILSNASADDDMRDFICRASKCWNVPQGLLFSEWPKVKSTLEISYDEAGKLVGIKSIELKPNNKKTRDLVRSFSKGVQSCQRSNKNLAGKTVQISMPKFDDACEDEAIDPFN